MTAAANQKERYPEGMFDPRSEPCWMVGNSTKEVIDQQWVEWRKRKEEKKRGVAPAEPVAGLSATISSLRSEDLHCNP
jgi:hypothetical protein